jgi:hypothetical protein
MPEVEIRFVSDWEYERLRHIREKYGVQWRGMLIQGAKHLEGHRHTKVLSRAPRERHVSPDCTGRPTENDNANADTDVDRERSSESQ